MSWFAIKTFAVALPTLLLFAVLPPAAAETESATAVSCVDERIQGLRSSAEYAEALEPARARLEACRGQPGVQPWEISDAESLIVTLETIASLPEADRQELATADRLQAVHDEARDAWKLDEAVDAAEQQLLIRRRHLGDVHPEVFDSLASLALATRRTGEVDLGEELTREALTVGRAVFASDHPDLARALDAAASALLDLHKNAQARPLAQEALEMRRRIFGAEHTEVADSLHTLASLCGTNDYSERVRLNLKALAMRRQTLGPEHLDVAESLHQLGYAYKGDSQWGLSEKTLREALAMQRRLDQDEMLVAATLRDLADLVRWQYDLAEAEELLLEVIAVQRPVLGAHPILAESLEDLAMLHRFARESDKAFPLLVETLAIRRQTLGEGHLGTLTAQANLALNHSYRGDHATADRIFVELRRHVAGAGDEVDLTWFDRLLDLYMAAAAERAGDYAKAVSLQRRHLEKMRASGHTIAIADSSRRLGGFLAGLGDLEQAEKIFAEAASGYENARTKVTAGPKAATFGKTPYEQLALCRLERGRTSEAWPAVEAARARVLADLLVAAKTRDASPLVDVPFDLERVQASLDTGTAIVGWLDFRLHREKTRSWAYLIRNDGPVRWVRLSSDLDLDDLASRLRAFRDSLGATAGSALGGPSNTFMREAHDLWADRFAPLEGHLENIEELVLIPSWAMGGFPVGAMIDADDRFVSERFDISYVPSASFHTWLHEIHGGGDRGARTALLIGDPPFRREHLANPLVAGQTAAAPTSSPTVLLSVLRGDERAAGQLPRLYGSRREVGRVAALFDSATVLLGSDASEPAVELLAESDSMTTYDVIHIATHALIDNERPQRSGLVLSQVNLPDPLQTDGSVNYDGIITGAEIIENWELDADLVTLSACRTALGKNVFGEGVVGLSYPFLQAGARSLLVSLWKVDDQATALLMERFYKNWLRRGHDSREAAVSKTRALREAKRWLRNYEDEAGERPYAHPYYWSAFVLLGDPQ